MPHSPPQLTPSGEHGRRAPLQRAEAAPIMWAALLGDEVGPRTGLQSPRIDGTGDEPGVQVHHVESLLRIRLDVVLVGTPYLALR
jgi:hypothetical protein